MSRDRNVLVVDDEPATLDFLADTIRAMGVTVTSVQDGAAALAAAAQRTPDLVLLDALLPKMDGFQVLAALRKSHPAVPVVMMSGIYRKRSYETEAVDRLGAVEYLCKPIPVLKLWELVERYAPPGSVVAPPVAAPGAHFQATPLPAVVADLERKRDTGLLFVRGSGGTAILFFEDGRLVFGRSNNPQSRLDRVLRATGRLSAEGQARAHEILSVGKGKVRLGELLVAEGLVSEDDVRHALAEQQRQHVLRPFSWTNASSSFVLSDAPRHETFKLSFDTHALVFWGCRALPDESVLNAWLPPGSSLMKLSVDPASVAVRFSLTPAEVELLSLADGTRDLAKLRAMGRMAQVDVPRLVTAFTCLGLAEALPGALQPEAPASGPIRASVAGAGDLERTSAAALLVAIHFSGKTGVLRAQAPGGAQAAKRAIYFDGGRVAFATSTAPEDRLGQVLLRSGLVSTAALSEALASAKDRPGTSLGRLLVDQKALSLDDLHRALVAQVQHVVASLIGWRRGTFRFEEGNPDRPEIVPLSLSTLEAVLVALRGSAFTALAAQRPETDCILRRAPSCFDLAGEFPLSPLEDTVLLAVDRGASTGQVLARLS